MFDFQQKRKIRSILYHKVTIIILSLLVILAIRSTWALTGKLLESKKERGIAELKVKELENKEKNLNNKIQALDTEHGLEEEIRTKFSVSKGDELVAIILDDNSSTQSTSTHKESFWSKVKNFFGF